MRKRKCKGCNELFRIEGVKINLNWFHDFSCATQYATAKSRKDREKAARKQVKQEKKAHTKAKKELRDNDKAYQDKKAQRIFNRYIRLRDYDDNCISCLRWHDGQWHAGHFLSRGAYRELRFHPDNCHKQCSACNNYLSGNINNYRHNLILKLGLERVEALEGPQKQRKYTIDNLKTIQRWYTRKLKRLEREMEDV